MELTIVEKGKNKIKIEVKGETHTFLNLLRERAWQCGCEQASYILEHPTLSYPKLIVKAKNPVKVLVDSTQKIIDEVKEFSVLFSRALKK